MAKLFLAALLALGAAPVQSQPSSPSPPIQPFVDSAEARQAARNLTACLARSRPLWARQTLSHPYLSDAQASVAAQALNGTDRCVRGDEAEVTFRSSLLVGSLAEHFLGSEIEKADSDRVADALYTLIPLNVSEDFALCVAARNPDAARSLALSEPGSATETEAAGKLAVHVGPCVSKGEQLTVDLQALRAMTSTALYRGVRTVLAARN